MPPKHIKSKRASKRNLSKPQLEKLKNEFDAIDTNHNGQLDFDELTKVMKDNSYHPEFANVVIKIFDEDENGEISFDEFIDFTNAVAKLEIEPDILHKMLFQKLDKDKTGNLDTKGIHSFFNCFASEPLSDDDVHTIILSYDQDGDGKLSYNELMKAFEP